MCSEELTLHHMQIFFTLLTKSKCSCRLHFSVTQIREFFGTKKENVVSKRENSWLSYLHNFFSLSYNVFLKPASPVSLANQKLCSNSVNKDPESKL